MRVSFVPPGTIRRIMAATRGERVSITGQGASRSRYASRADRVMQPVEGIPRWDQDRGRAELGEIVARHGR